jgi:hypothetical protein
LLPEEARVRARLAEHWTAIGLMEHASIAAFARFSLQLLALGAPADLVEQSNQALADELQHTELAFALASAYGGGAVGPGPLAIDGSLEEQSLEAIVRLVVVEGCIGETVAALEAREAAAHAMDPVVRAALERIADDEAGHAALAWRTLRWATECSRADGSSAGDEAIVGTIEAAFEQGLRALSESNPDHDDLTRHGVLSSSLRSELCKQACTVLRAGFASLRAHSEARGRAA